MSKEKFKNKLIKRLGGYTANEVEEIQNKIKETINAYTILEERLNIAESNCEALDSKLREVESTIKIITVTYDPKTDVDTDKARQALLKRLCENTDFKSRLTISKTTSTNDTPHYSLSTGIILPQVFYGDTFNEILSK